MEKSFGELLKELRETRGYSMNKLAERTGVDVAHISRLESGKRGAPKPDTITKLAKVLGNYEKLMAAANYLTPEHGVAWENAKAYIVNAAIDAGKDESLINKIAKEYNVPTSEVKEFYKNAKEVIDGTPIETQIEYLSRIFRTASKESDYEEYVLSAPTLSDATIRIAELDSRYGMDDKTFTHLSRLAFNKHGLASVKGSEKAAGGIKTPGTGALEDTEKDDND